MLHETGKNLIHSPRLGVIFHSIYPSSAAADEILALYDLTPTTPLTTLHANLTNFITDTMFGYPRSQASDFFHLPLTPAKGSYHQTPMREYKVKFGDPFPGPGFRIAHHCVELIYIFDAFHDFLVEADEAEKNNSTPPSSLTPPHEIPEELYNAARTNAELTSDMQRDWIGFVMKGEVEERGDEIKVYGNNRESKIESLSKDEEWIVYKRKLEVLGREREASKLALKKINGW